MSSERKDFPAGSTANASDSTTTTDLALREFISEKEKNRGTRKQFSGSSIQIQQQSSINPQPLQRVDRHVVAEDSYYYSEDDYATLDHEEDSLSGGDATKSVHETHYALLYLMSNPEEFKGVTGTMAEWTDGDSEISRGNNPLPFVVFATDAEVVLPQAHTASQLFGVETVRGVELEAAAGIQALSSLFLRWLALMPGGDHMNLIDPPGLTVMRIAGGRYRVTAAHRVVWTWLNDFLPEAVPSYGTSDDLKFVFGDLVTMTIVDVFETDKDGKLLSYCPTFDNREIRKTNVTGERIFKEKMKVKGALRGAANSQAAVQVNKAANFLGRIGFQTAVMCKDRIRESFIKNSPSKEPGEKIASPVHPSFKGDKNDAEAFQKAMNVAEAATDKRSNDLYISDDDTTQTEDQR